MTQFLKLMERYIGSNMPNSRLVEHFLDPAKGFNNALARPDLEKVGFGVKGLNADQEEAVARAVKVS